MPRPLNEHQTLEQERVELSGRIAAYQRELAETLTTKTRREFLDWQIRNLEKRLAEVEARLAVGGG